MEEESPSQGIIPKRLQIAILLFLMLTHAFTVRGTTRTFIRVVMETSGANSTVNLTSECKHIKQKGTELTYLSVRGVNYSWNQNDIDYLSKIFTSSYSALQFIGGYLSDKYGSKYLIASSMGLGSLLMTIIPTAIYSSNGDKVVLYLLTFLRGISQGLMYPSVCACMAHWIPEKEKARLGSFIWSATALGLSMNVLATDYVFRIFINWSSPFYIYGGIGLLLCLLWMLFGASSPEDCPTIGYGEIIYLRKQFKNTVNHDTKKVPVFKILLSRDVWVVTIAFAGNLWYWHLTFFFLDIYMHKVLLMKQTDAHLFKFFPYLLMMATSIVTGVVSDYAMSKHVKKEAMRKITTNLANIGSNIYFVAGSYAACQENVVKTLFTISYGLEGCVFASLYLVPLDLSPNYAGTLLSIFNGIGILTAFITNSYVNAIAPNKNLMEYRLVFWYSLTICTVTNLIFVIFGRTDVKEWNNPNIANKQK